MNNTLLIASVILMFLCILWFVVYKAILRTGSLNPIDWIWGPRLYGITQLDQDDLLIEIDQFPGDEYMVDWRITMTESYRDKGPWFGRKRKLVSFDANWAAIEVGIPTNRGYIKDTWSGTFPIKDPFDWRYDACKQLEDWVKRMRQVNGYVGQVTDFTNTDEGIQISGVVFDEQLRKMISEGTMKGMSIGYPSQEVETVFYDGFGAPISNPDPKVIEEARIISWGPDKNGLGEIITSTSDNDLLKEKYTIEELAQQAINRDKDPED